MEDGDKLLQGAYEANYERLLAIKTKYDPDNLFHGAVEHRAEAVTRVDLPRLTSSPPPQADSG